MSDILDEVNEGPYGEDEDAPDLGLYGAIVVAPKGSSTLRRR